MTGLSKWLLGRLITWALTHMIGARPVSRRRHRGGRAVGRRCRGPAKGAAQAGHVAGAWLQPIDWPDAGGDDAVVRGYRQQALMAVWHYWAAIVLLVLIGGLCRAGSGRPRAERGRHDTNRIVVHRRNSGVGFQRRGCRSGEAARPDDAAGEADGHAKTGDFKLVPLEAAAAGVPGYADDLNRPGAAAGTTCVSGRPAQKNVAANKPVTSSDLADHRDDEAGDGRRQRGEGRRYVELGPEHQWCRST